jgi:iron complex outermembrane recepter protein
MNTFHRHCSYTASLLTVMICAPLFALEPSSYSANPSPFDSAVAAQNAGRATSAGHLAADPLPVAELEQLLQSAVEVPALEQTVTTVSGQASTVGRSPAAVFVITQEMIRRSGYTTIPEVLRLAPGLQVARINSNQWAVTSRGFNNNIAGLLASNNKLLVLIDGRTVYTPFFGGVFWDVQDVLLEDVERIEVIRGPGATIWGANAVNGVINVITMGAQDTQGGLTKAGGGNVERGFVSARQGGQQGENLHYRVYGKWFERGASFHPTFPADADDWRQGRGGFRTDWTPTDMDMVTLQGDFYAGQSGFFNTAGGVNLNDDERVTGGNLLTRWTRTLDEHNDVSLQFYYDRADRQNNIGFIDQEFNTYDVDFRHHFVWDCNHNVVWGLGYRSVHDSINPLTAPPAIVLSLDPARRAYDTFSVFAQDEMTLREDLFLTVGAKLQHNDFAAWEVQPSVRLLYSPDPSWATWTSVSRAVRIPSRVEQDATIAAGVVPFLQFSRAFTSEELIAYELGYRSQPESWYSWDVATFFNQYERLSALRLTPPGVIPITTSNGNRGEGYGVELSGQVEITPCWRFSGHYTFLQLLIHPGPGTVNFLGSTGEAIEGSSPHNQIMLMSSHDLSNDWQVDFIGRYVDELTFLPVPSYITMDMRLAWRPSPCTELAIAGQNLLDERHAEYFGGYEIKRGVYGMITHQW